MLPWIAGIIAALAGVLFGYLFRSASAKTEKAQREGRVQELTSELGALRLELTRAQADAIARAGFESVAAEREKTVLQLNAERETLQKTLDLKTKAEQEQAANVSRLQAELKSERDSSQEKLKLLIEARTVMTDQFKSLANDILEDKSTKFTEQNKTNLDQLLNPLRTQITEFRGKVEEAQKDALEGRVEFRTQLKSLESLNLQLSDEAHNLAMALRGDKKAQGNWGEYILLNILENSGLRKGEHYTFQESFLDIGEDGVFGKRRQTDVIVQLPEGRHLIIDSKVSIDAYNDSLKAADDKQRAECVRRHVLSVRNHYLELSGRNYQVLSGLQSPDFVVMFIPIEPAFMLVLREDENLWMDAYKRNVLLTGPTTVLFIIRIVENLWRQERQARNVDKVMKRGAQLYEKFVGFVEDLSEVGSSLDSARSSFSEAYKKLSVGDGNLVRQVEMLRQLGVKPKKSLKPGLLQDASADEASLYLAAEADES